VSPDAPEPISAVVERFEATLDLATVAAEVGLSAVEFEAKLRRSTTQARLLGPLLVRGGTVQRSAFELAFNEVLREFRPGSEYDAATSTSTKPIPLASATAPFAGHTGTIGCIAISADGKKALSGSEDQTVRLWDVATGRELLRLRSVNEEILGVAISPDGREAATAVKDGTVRLWDLESGKQRLAIKAHTERATVVAFTPDGRGVLSGGWDRTLVLWDVKTGEELLQLSGHGGRVTSLAISGDGRIALSGGSDGIVHQWDLAAGREVRRLDGHVREVFGVAISRDGKRALSGGADRTVRLWDLGSGKVVKTFDGLDTAPIGVAFAPDEHSIAAACSQYRSGNKPLRIWDVENGRVRTLGGATDTLWSVAFAPDGRFALTGSTDKTLRLWRLVQEP
jgi:WD40 repeat protein